MVANISATTKDKMHGEILIKLESIEATMENMMKTMKE